MPHTEVALIFLEEILEPLDREDILTCHRRRTGANMSATRRLLSVRQIQGGLVHLSGMSFKCC